LLSTSPAAPETEPTINERAAWESEVLGQLVSVHPLQLVAAELDKHAVVNSNELSQHPDERVTVAGIRLAAHRFAVKQESMMLVDMEDRDGMYQVLWSGAVLNKYRSLLSQRDPVLVRGRVRADRQGQAILTGIEITPLASIRAVKS
jgi:DNA polymerase III alpha subunit